MTDDPGNLNRLQDIVMPDPAPWWPLAPGWYVVGAIILAAVTYVSVRAVRKYRANAYRRAGLASLESTTTDAEVSSVMKRVAMVAFGRNEVASLSGVPWCEWLEHHGGPPMGEAQRAALVGGIYGEDRSSGSSLKAYAASWIQSHSVSEETQHEEVVA